MYVLHTKFAAVTCLEEGHFLPAVENRVKFLILILWKGTVSCKAYGMSNSDSVSKQNIFECLIVYAKNVDIVSNRCSAQPLRRARIPDAVFVQLFLLRMGMSRPETCRG